VAYALVAFALVAVFWGGVFAFTSRRLEQAADAFAARAAGAGAFAAALARVAVLSGGPRAASAWLHFPIARRIAMVQGPGPCGSGGAVGCGLKKAFALAGATVLLGAGAFAYQISDSLDSRTTFERTFIYAWYKKDYGRALETAEAALRNCPGWAHAHYLRAGALDELGRYEEARESLLAAMELEPGEKEYARQLDLLEEKNRGKRRKKDGSLPGDGNPAAE
jgi:tetratricopeptide (TPR) repeat protein